MNDKKPIDRKRESAGHTDVGSAEDGAIVGMKNIGGRLLVFKEKSIYEMIMADQVDPDRTNINLPNMIQKLIIDKGTESEIVSRILMTAVTLFKPEYINKTIDSAKVIGLAIDLLSEISMLEKEIGDYKIAELKASEEYEDRKIKNLSYKLPSIVNLESKCKTIYQKADHVEQTLMEIIINFYPNLGLTKQSHFPNLLEKLKNIYGEKDSFVEFIDKTLHFMQVIRELRNGFDHRLDHTKVYDFDLQKNGDVIAPSIELRHKKIKLERTSLIEFLESLEKNIIDITEVTFAYLASNNIKPNGMQYQVKEIPLEKRRNKFMKFSFWAPFGNEGYYMQ